ncbi:hypothetical protein PABY_10940 [Pyrodictium abyssi]|uniref:Uncharacterized protein n=2 Tax=Pyrodictium abyssi TaxID=54256 RepID=A0ABN6ZMM7_9CREN|nr:hypothetical protein PABY_10940 [Pyrodictium abyssi]
MPTWLVTLSGVYELYILDEDDQKVDQLCEEGRLSRETQRLLC